MKPCPGCGMKDGVWVDDCGDRAESPKLRFSVVCVCGWIGPPRETKEAAIEIWNLREEVSNDA